jgi:CHAT domain-containing protein/tetratricopeptide (TPR) repeat protein
MGGISKLLLLCGRILTVAAALLLIPAARAETWLQGQISQHEQQLAQARQSRDLRSQASELNTLGWLYHQAGDPMKGIDDCNLALGIERLPTSIAVTHNILGRIYTDLGDEQRAFDLYNQALPVFRQTGDRKHEAEVLNNMGRTYNNLAQRDKALEVLNQALPASREVRYREGEATALDAIGRAYLEMGREQDALPYLNQAMPIWREIDGQSGAAQTLNNFGRVYADLGEKEKALDDYNQSLALFRQIGNIQGEARNVHFIGKVYGDLGQKPMALDYLNQALALWQKTRNRNGEALALNDIGRIHADQGNELEALDFYNRALPIWREVRNRRGEAVTLTDIGRSYSALGRQNEALNVDYLSLGAWREAQDRRGEAFALSSIGRVYSRLGQQQTALPLKVAALRLAKDADDPDIEGGIETSLMLDFRAQSLREEAIFFGTEAVNAYQKLRRGISNLDPDVQAGFAESKSAAYRILAELLVEDDRLGAAEQVLDLLKEQELKEVVRGAAENSKSQPVPLTSSEQKADAGLSSAEDSSAALMDVSIEYAGLMANNSRTPEQATRLKLLDAKLEAANGEVSTFFRKTLYPELSQKAGSETANALLNKEKTDVSTLQNTLAGLGPNVLGIRLLLGDDRAYAIVVTPQGRKKFDLPTTPSDLRSKILEARDALRTPSSDPLPKLQGLYAIVIAPIAGELSALETSAQTSGKTPTLLWSLDGAMRYLPMAALYDGHHFLVERFQNVLFTPESYGHMTDASAATGAKTASLSVLAMGISRSYGGLPPLPGVLSELNAVVHDPAAPESHGPLTGVLLPNESFTYAALKSQLGATSYPVVHIASHFVLQAGDGAEPYLMLAGDDAGSPDGYPLTLSKLEDSPVTFHGTRLLTLSACSTAKGDTANDGLEVDSLGMIAQQKDAQAVLATLWDVNDASTSQLMSDFYARWMKSPAAGKAEALRQAQLALLRGSASANSATPDRGFQSIPDVNPTQPKPHYSHPYYWAPFVLTGNYQ